MINELNPLLIGNMKIKIPIIQGGMGVKISDAKLASAVANCGGAGTIASVGLGYGKAANETHFLRSSNEGLREEIKTAKTLTDGYVGVNILFALSNYDNLVGVAIEEKTDFISSGAGLPLKLPELTEGKPVNLIPIVSSARAADIIIRTWKKRYNRFPDAIIVEGPKAGGHLGFRPEELNDSGFNLECLVQNVLNLVDFYESEYNISIPVIAAGGIFDGKDIAGFLKMGAKGVQIASRFVVTQECLVTNKIKELYIASGEEDILVIKSPVGMPGRVIKTGFIEKMLAGECAPVKCNYKCLKTCNPKTTPYCIAKALYNALDGDLDNAIVFAGNNVSRIKEIIPVDKLMDSLVAETIAELNS